MIERFITILRRAEVSLDYRQIEDALWLSGVLPRHTVEESDESPEPPKPGAGEAEDRKRDQQRPTMQPQSAEHTRNLYTPSTAATGAQFSASRIRVQPYDHARLHARRRALVRCRARR